MILAPTNRRIIRPYDKPSFEHTQRYGLIRDHPLGPAGGLVGLWLFNEGSGGQVFDLSGNGNTGAGSLVWVPGKYGPALSLNGISGHADTPFDCSAYDELTIIISVNTNSIVGTDYIADQSDGSVGFGLRRVDEAIAFFCYSDAAPGTVISNYNMVVGQDVQVAVVHSTNNTIYINGVYDNAAASALGIDDSSDTMRIGAEYDGDNPWDGIINYMMIYNLALPASEIAQPCREPFCMVQKKTAPVYFFVPAVGADWIGINSSHLDSCCHAGEGGALLTGALDGTGYWYHDADETHWFIIDLGATYNIQKVRGRSEIISFDPTDVNVYVNNTGEAPWGDAVASGIDTWQNTADWVEIEVTPTSGRFVKVEIVDTEDVGGGIGFGCTSPNFAIFDVYGEAAAPPTGIPILRRRRAG